MERELAVIDHRRHSPDDHPIRDHTPKVSVFTESANTPLPPAAIKRHRFIQNLKNNHLKLIEALAYVERFAIACELSEERTKAIRKAKDDAEEELTRRFQEKLQIYDERIKEGSQ